MPIPKPRKNEKKDDFISRCMGDENMQEYEEAQRYKVCETEWEKRGVDVKPTYLAGFMRAAGENRKMSFRASTTALDRHGTKIAPTGFKTANFDKNPVFLWSHDGYGGWGRVPEPENVIGRVTAHTSGVEGFDVDVEFAPAEMNERAELLYQLTKAGFLNAVSVGVIPLRMHDEKAADGSFINVIDEAELLEVSLVPIPSNPEALAVARSMGDIAGKSETLIGNFLTRIGRKASKARIEKIRKAHDLHTQAHDILKDVLAEIDSDKDDDSDDSQKTAPPAPAADAGVESQAVRDGFVSALIRDCVRSAVRR